MAIDHRHIAAVATSTLLVVLIASVLSSQAQATDVNYCDDEKYAVQVYGVDIDPDPVKRGKTATFSISLGSETKITKGKMLIDVEYFGFNVHEETYDLCEKTQCPILGDFVVSHSQSLPIFTPPGTYTLKMKMYGDDEKLLTCINFDFSIGFFAPIADI
ncbi:putative Phosphatidylglycerol/phosphatidylinositol transfer protein [Zostera marina]|uniref:Putative Phosphatidylglycerol/phosphatidylinositol transfer protein n=1 Tax=Zostera marina TaxID=29655 RepID=A0A0K9NZR0_ZOSMR|nr:putative Phosphatidylglycerol/phosphatidylinositol transfer protein [Zostera marina]